MKQPAPARAIVLALAAPTDDVVAALTALAGVGAPGARALSMLDIGKPALRCCEIARGMGINSERVETTAAFAAVFRAMLKTAGPHLIEVLIARFIGR